MIMVVYMYAVYIWKWSSAHALGDVNGVALIITTDEQLQYAIWLLIAFYLNVI